MLDAETRLRGKSKEKGLSSRWYRQFRYLYVSKRQSVLRNLKTKREVTKQNKYKKEKLKIQNKEDKKGGKRRKYVYK